MLSICVRGNMALQNGREVSSKFDDGQVKVMLLLLLPKKTTSFNWRYCRKKREVIRFRQVPTIARHSTEMR